MCRNRNALRIRNNRVVPGTCTCAFHLKCGSSACAWACDCGCDHSRSLFLALSKEHEMDPRALQGA